MMRVPFLRELGAVIILALAALALTCSGVPSGPIGGFETPEGTGYVFFKDAPPVGTSILKFEITLSSATLCPTVGSAGECTGSPQVAMVSAPVRIELTQLQLQTAFLGLKDAPAGTYAGVRMTFSNPKLKVLLPDGTIQELIGVDLPLNPANVTPTFSPGLTVTGDTNFGFLIDFNARDSVQSVGSAITGIAPVVSLVRQTFTTGQPVEELEDAQGKISGLTKTCATETGTFNLTDSLTGLTTAGVRFDSTTEFADGLTCELLTNDQIVEANIELRSENAQTAVFIATEIELVNEANESGLEGTVFQVNTASEFVLLVHHSEGGSGIPNDAFVTVSFDPQDVIFKLGSDGLPADAPLFASGAHLLAGQNLELDVVSVVLGTHNCAEVEDNCTAIVDEIKLKKSIITANVGPTIVQPNFSLVNLPSFFGVALPLLLRPLSADCQNCLIDTLTVRTAEGTEFEDLPGGFSGLITGSTVTVRGLLFKGAFQGPGPTSAGLPLLVAEKVRLVTTAP